MSQCLDYWESTIGPLGIIIDCLPREMQKEIVERLQLLAQVYGDRGDLTASYYARALSGEPFPVPKPRPKLTVV